MGETCCCGCMTVAQGSLVLGILNIISSFFGIIRNGALAVTLLNNPNADLPTEPGKAEIVEHRALLITIAFVGLFMSLAYLIVSIMLVQACRTHNHRLAMPWLIWNYVSLGLAGAVGVIMFFVLAFNESVLLAFLVLIFMGIGLAIGVYFVRVVQRYVNELKGIY